MCVSPQQGEVRFAVRRGGGLAGARLAVLPLGLSALLPAAVAPLRRNVIFGGLLLLRRDERQLDVDVVA